MTTTGVLGKRWRATVTAWGAVQPWGDDDALDWHIAADDRWHSPVNEAAVRQQRIDGTPVVETRVRIPGGDAVHRVYSVADSGGMTVVQVTNESSLPIAVAFTRGDVKTSRAPTAGTPPGIDLPPSTIVMPVGHQATVSVALAHDGSGAGPLPPNLSPALQVARGWSAAVDRAGRYVLPDAAIAEGVATARCELALRGPDHYDTDPMAFLLGVGQLVRMGERADDWLVDVAAAVERCARVVDGGWRMSAALDAAAVVLHAANERRALRDLRTVRARVVPDHAPQPVTPVPTGVDLLSWIDALFCDRTGALFPSGLPTSWLGANVEAYDVPVLGSLDADLSSRDLPRVSLAIRWHGERPAVLWESTAVVGGFSSPRLAPAWSSAEPRGEALWPPPPSEHV